MSSAPGQAAASLSDAFRGSDTNIALSDDNAGVSDDIDGLSDNAGGV